MFNLKAGSPARPSPSKAPCTCFTEIPPKFGLCTYLSELSFKKLKITILWPNYRCDQLHFPKASARAILEILT